MNEIENQVFEEAISRIAALTEKFSLNPNILQYFEEGKVYYSYITGGVIGSIDTISYDKRYEKAVADFEREYKGYKVYHAIECGDMLSLLYVSSNVDDWKSERLNGNHILSYTINFSDQLSEFGYIGVSGYMESGALIRMDGLIENSTSEDVSCKQKPTKRQMVDYINTRVRFQGKKLPKNKLNLLSAEELMTIIDSNPEMKADFEKYVAEAVDNPQKTSSSKRASKKIVLAEVSEEKTKELWDAVNELVKEPFSLLAMMKFNSILVSLPYGTVSTDELNKMVSALTHADQNVMGMAVKLLEYSAKQASYTNK